MTGWTIFIRVLILGLPAMAFAGDPARETITCPVGGEEFTITTGSMCSAQGRTMSLRHNSSCDFVTRLPVCPENGLPVYQQFSDEQILMLQEFMRSPEYQALLSLPPWQRAYGIARHLDQAGTDTGFAIVINAMWYETGPFFENADFPVHFRDEADRELQRMRAGQQPYLQALLAYVLSNAGRVEAANTYLDRVEAVPDLPDDLRRYIAAVRSCQADMSKPGCRPDDPFGA